MHYPIFLVVYLGMSVQNTIAVLQGLWGVRSAFIRTPKFSGKANSVASYQNKKISWITFIEIAVLCYFLYAIALSFFLGDYFLIAFFMMMVWGLSILVFKSLETKMMGSFFTKASSFIHRKYIIGK
jgi:hypothetical protein